MSIELLQEKIRKSKCPIVMDFSMENDLLPAKITEQFGSNVDRWGYFYRQYLLGLKGVVPAVRFHLSQFALLGDGGMSLLSELLTIAKNSGYYVILDSVEAYSPAAAAFAADNLFAENAPVHFDALVLSAGIGADALKPYIKHGEGKTALFVVMRTGNKSAAELQDLLAGPRLAHVATADVVNRLGEPFIGRSGYMQVAGVAAATSPDSLRLLRSKYKHLFLLLDGYDYPNGNAKNCSFAFDRLGHGAAVCAGSSITGAWLTQEHDGADFVTDGVEAAQRIQKNILRYVTIL